jgi:hypothetical protein
LTETAGQVLIDAVLFSEVGVFAKGLAAGFVEGGGVLMERSAAVAEWVSALAPNFAQDDGRKTGNGKGKYGDSERSSE